MRPYYDLKMVVSSIRSRILGGIIDSWGRFEIPKTERELHWREISEFFKKKNRKTYSNQTIIWISADFDGLLLDLEVAKAKILGSAS